MDGSPPYYYKLPELEETLLWIGAIQKKTTWFGWGDSFCPSGTTMQCSDGQRRRGYAPPQLCHKHRLCFNIYTKVHIRCHGLGQWLFMEGLFCPFFLMPEWGFACFSHKIKHPHTPYDVEEHDPWPLHHMALCRFCRLHVPCLLNGM